MPSQLESKADAVTKKSWTEHDANIALHQCLSTRQPPLPNEIILQILEHPSRWLHVQSKTLHTQSTDSPSTQPLIRISGNGTDEKITVLLSTDKLPQYQIAGLRKLVFKLRSRDQGWSSWPEHTGTFENSWTWFEAGIRKDDVPAMSADHADDESSGSPENAQRYKRHVLQRNRHATRQPETYSLEFGPDDPLAANLGEGDVIDLLGCARYPGWENIIYEASIDMWVFDDLSDQISPS